MATHTSKSHLAPCVITAGKRSCGKVMFLHLSVSDSVHRRGGSASGAGECTPPLDTPPLDTPPDTHPPWTHTLLGHVLPGHPMDISSDTTIDTPPLLKSPAKSPGHTPLDTPLLLPQSTSGRYASYWNAFLLQIVMQIVISSNEMRGVLFFWLKGNLEMSRRISGCEVLKSHWFDQINS